MQEIIFSVMEIYAPAAEKKDVTLRTSVERPMEVFADVNHVRVILRNLIGNALKFTDAKGFITIDCCMEGEEVITCVEDTGKGMSAEKQASLFSIETNVSTGGTSGEQGVGLGLLLVKEFSEKNDGRVWVESELNKGTTFFFSLPTVKRPQ